MNMPYLPKQKPTTWEQLEMDEAMRSLKIYVYLFFIFTFVAIFCLLVLPRVCQAQTPCPSIDIERLADAIYWAEGGAKTSHPYGILTKYKVTTPRQACINTIKSALKRFNDQTKETDFIVFLGNTYCPIGAKNDPKGLNKNWVKNVKYFLNKEMSK